MTRPLLKMTEMVNKKLNILIQNIGILSFMVLLSFPLYAQDEWEGRGEIEEAEVVIEKDRKIMLPVAHRIFERVPDFEQKISRLGLNYTYLPIKYQPGDLQTRVRPLIIKTMPLPAVRNGNVKLGYGNYRTPFLEANYGTGRNDEYLYNIYLRHRSSGLGPVDDENSADSESIVAFDGSIYLNDATFSGGLSYKLDRYTFYGYNPSLDVAKSDIEQFLHNFNLFGKIVKNSPDNNTDYFATVVFDYVQDKFGAAEADFGLNIFGSFPANENLSIDVISDFYLINRTDVLLPSHNRFFVRIKPYANYSYDRVHVDGGLSVVMENDTLGSEKGVRVFPYLDINYKVSESTIVYGGYKGDVDKGTLKNYLGENRYLESNAHVFNQIRGFDFYTGIKGKFGSHWNYKIEADLAYYKNRAYFVNNSLDSTKFDILYDTGTGNQNRFFGSFGYDISNKANFTLMAEHNFYSTEKVTEAWHKPSYIVGFQSSLLLVEKFKITADINLMGGIKAMNISDGSPVSLDPIANIDLGLQYIISGRASLYANSYNLLGNSYQRYLNYISRELQWIAGISFSF